MSEIRYIVELANKIKHGKCVGNLWCVALHVDGCRTNWVFGPQESEVAARRFAREANAEATLGTGLCSNCGKDTSDMEPMVRAFHPMWC